jgi:hypothetical protein
MRLASRTAGRPRRPMHPASSDDAVEVEVAAPLYGASTPASAAGGGGWASFWWRKSGGRRRHLSVRGSRAVGPYFDFGGSGGAGAGPLSPHPAQPGVPRTTATSIEATPSNAPKRLQLLMNDLCHFKNARRDGRHPTGRPFGTTHGRAESTLARRGGVPHVAPSGVMAGSYRQLPQGVMTSLASRKESHAFCPASVVATSHRPSTVTSDGEHTPPAIRQRVGTGAEETRS